ncbi:hypothetical protein AJ79_07390 [Helicocarpus griseus UAMH5409]|uniref:L-type lectin-like domain-containing protein n=1 Tax=Helicocarpus griseus UAMH5409 TaxID=1447875 RepID=A0A2B7X3I7_9EURO|nr:hypothetical protein AJ79_07390 [Helicocarpus griseus UAMH5409]
MVRSWAITGLLALVSSFASVSQADTILESASFGHNGRISSDKRLIPGWQLSGRGHVPEKMSDRIILTPPHTGNKRGSLWAEQPLAETEWTVDFDFRANGEERGSGNLQIWYVKEGRTKVSTSSIYTVGPFDGFALAIDMHGGRGGTIRGFLNDGTKDYKNANVDSLAFGHCDYAYRNLGRLSLIQIKQSKSTFEVLVDKRRCFVTDKATGNSFGVTAASADTPDSFEVFKFAVSVPDKAGVGSQSYRSYENQQVPPKRPNTNGNQQQQQQPNAGNSDIDTRLSDLQNRFQTLVSSSERLLSEIQALSKKSDERHRDISSQLTPNRDHAKNMEQRMQRIETMLESIQKDVKNKDLQNQFKKLQDSLKNSHSGMMEHLQSTSHQLLSSTPRMGLFIFLIVAIQLALAASYIIYKRRRANMPKKFL